ncbi:hypothetical protein Taro_002430 [Colocasia esculenta]|uniref:RNase H type-1 domain-containing protein n=1 Tax=Colocasia esculenta TaxID=4460 RepID=A0A843TLI8_COLES|nr:hypothetical protein [Colocasia esculenta]
MLTAAARGGELLSSSGSDGREGWSGGGNDEREVGREGGNDEREGEGGKGQVINLSKRSFMMSQKVPYHTVNKIQSLTGFKRQIGPMMYLGVPLRPGRVFASDFKPLIEKNGYEGARRRHWVAWLTIQRPVAEGDLGVRNLKRVQVALAIKILWNIHHGSSLWAGYARKRFFSGSATRLPGMSSKVPANEDYNHLFNYGDLAVSLWSWFLPLISPKICNRRYLARFESKRPSAATIISKIKFMISSSIADMIFKVAPSPEELQVLQYYGFNPVASSKILKFVRWITPLSGFCLNVDRACKGNPGVCGGGGCIQNKKGELTMGFSHFYGYGNSMVAEIRALCDGIRMAESLGFQLSVIYSDSIALVNSPKTGRCPSWQAYRWWWEVSISLTRSSYDIRHVFQESNQVADALAIYACQAEENKVF